MAIRTLGKKYESESEAIRALQSELSRLEEQKQARAGTLKSLPKQAGLDSVDELIRELAEYGSPALRKKVLGRAAAKKKTGARKKKAASKKKTAGRKKRATKKKTTAGKKVAGKKKTAARKGSVKTASKKKTPARKRRLRAELTESMVEEMRKAFDAKMTGKEVAGKFGVSPSTVHNVKKRLGLTGR